MILVPPPLDQSDLLDDVSLADLLCDALDGDDHRRLHLMARLFLICRDPDRDTALDRLRREGIPKVFCL